MGKHAARWDPPQNSTMFRWLKAGSLMNCIFVAKSIEATIAISSNCCHVNVHNEALTFFQNEFGIIATPDFALIALDDKFINNWKINCLHKKHLSRCFIAINFLCSTNSFFYSFLQEVALVFIE